MAKSTHDSNPKAVAVAAYEAANRGLHRKANGFVAPAFRKELLRVHAAIGANDEWLRRALRRLAGRRDSTAVEARKSIRASMKRNRTLAKLRVGSVAFMNEMWDAATRGRSLLKVEATRQLVRGSRARFYLRLTLRDGTVISDSEPLVRHRGRWFLG